ncbi:hypothetical protein FH972_021780 [Carpinus fangiana]|uniref:RING-Gid-type domain-containing protein n=1 Tax=Carpinus fangiana TaxID=176857 RepID=A0A5N6KQA6_9ROSI|nr:hypothetical protein FH972_021780 [Carpinus fangiana]
MDEILKAHERLEKKDNLAKSVEEKFKDKPLPFESNDALASHPSLINRAIAMHLLREGHFDVAATFIKEANNNPPTSPERTMKDAPDMAQDSQVQSNARKAWEMDFSPSADMSMALHSQFQEMYSILNELRVHHNLDPAIEWARQHSQVLDARGSNLEYDLCRLQYLTLFRTHGPLAAVTYARNTFGKFHRRYEGQTLRLSGALAFIPNLGTSPYAADLSGPAETNTYSIASAAFTAEFCALLQLSSASPLLTAVTAGCIALPTLLKLSHIQQTRRTSWTTESELPVEIPLPTGYSFHSIFVCPVSKEQSTDSNPPMMLPCGHVVARDSMNQLSRGTRFKCPYCPIESHPKDAKKIYF